MGFFPQHSLGHCAPFYYSRCAFVSNLLPNVSCRRGHAQGAARHEDGGWRYRFRSAVELRLHQRPRVLCCAVAILGREAAQNIDNVIALCALVIKQLRFTCGGWTDAMRRFATDLAAPSRVTSVGPWPRTARRCCRSLSRKLSAPGGCALSGEYFSGNACRRRHDREFIESLKIDQSFSSHWYTVIQTCNKDRESQS